MAKTEADIRKELEKKASDALAETARLMKELEEARALNKKLVETSSSTVRVRPNFNTGTISVLGLNAKYPVTCYPSQWERLLTPAIIEAILGHAKDARLVEVAAKMKGMNAEARAAFKASLKSEVK